MSESREVQKHVVVMSSCHHVTEEGTENARDIIVQAREKRTGRFLLYKYIVTKLRCLKILHILQIDILATIAKDVSD